MVDFSQKELMQGTGKAVPYIFLIFAIFLKSAIFITKKFLN